MLDTLSLEPKIINRPKKREPSNFILFAALFICIWGPPRFGTSRSLSELASDTYTFNYIRIIELTAWGILGLFVLKSLAGNILLKRNRVFSLRYPLNFYFVFGLVALFTATYSLTQVYSFYRASQIVLYVLTIGLLVWQNSENWQKIFKIFILIALLNTTLIIVTFFIAPELVSIRSSSWGLRLFGRSFVPDYGSSGVVLFILTYIMFQNKDRRKWVLLIMCVSLIYVFLSRTRSNIFFLFLFLAMLPMIRKRVSLSLIFAVILGFGVALYLDLQYKIFLFLIRDEVSIYTLSSRTVWWYDLYESFKDAPFLGIGYLNAGQLIEMFGQGSSHNSYIEILVGTGLVGFTFFIVPLLSTTSYFLKKLPTISLSVLELQVFFLFVWLILTAFISSHIATPGYVFFLMIHIVAYGIIKRRQQAYERELR